MRALITGGGGQLASELARCLGPDAVSLRHSELDITDDTAVARALRAATPEVVFNCGAYHNVEECERHPDLAWSVNVDSVRRLAARSPMLVHISTNYVFDGERAAPYGEGDLPSPRSVYSITKLAGEYAALAYAERALVVRTGGLYGLQGSESKGGNFVQRMIKRARDGNTLTVVSDQRVQPTYTRDLADAIVEAVSAGVEGTVHLTASGACSWHEFTVAIMRCVGISASVTPATTARASRGVSRPMNGVLARPRADECGLSPLRHWGDMLKDYVEQAGLSNVTTSMTAEG